MSRKRAVVSQPDTADAKADLPSERFEVDAFDRFIEEQLKKQKSSDDQSTYEVVCHVY